MFFSIDQFYHQTNFTTQVLSKLPSLWNMGVLGRYDVDRDELGPAANVVKGAWRYDETSDSTGSDSSSCSSETELLDFWMTEWMGPLKNKWQ